MKRVNYRLDGPIGRLPDRKRNSWALPEKSSSRTSTPDESGHNCAPGEWESRSATTKSGTRITWKERVVSPGVLERVYVDAPIGNRSMAVAVLDERLELEQIAGEEAAHAVVAVSVGFDVGVLSVKPQGDSLGRCDAKAPPLGDPFSDGYNLITVLLAGRAYEPAVGQEQDIREARETAGRLALSDSEADCLYEAARARAEAIIAGESFQRAHSHIRDRLLAEGEINLRYVSPRRNVNPVLELLAQQQTPDIVVNVPQTPVDVTLTQPARRVAFGRDGDGLITEAIAQDVDQDEGLDAS